ncbi:MAG: F1F0 ATPase subunit 2 [Planctomycetota bacterium]|jgi:F1F0 ATPase subunit 2
MNDYMHLLFALVAGVLLGMFFFAGLWWTVRKLDHTEHIALLFLASLLFRSSIVLLGFYFILGDNWKHLLAGLCGFIIARKLLFMLVKSEAQQSGLISQKADHAP